MTNKQNKADSNRDNSKLRNNKLKNKKSKKSKKHHIHDAAFKRSVADRRHILKEIIKASLNKEQLKLIDLDSIQPLSTDLVDEELKTSRPDVLLSMKLKSGDVVIDIFVVLEHKSFDDPLMLRSLLKYKSFIYNSAECIKLGVIPIVLVVYHGDSISDPVVRFQDLILKKVPKQVTEAFGANFIDFTCLLLNLRKVDVLKKLDSADAKLFGFVFKNIKCMDDETYKELLHLINSYANNLDDSLVRELLQYVGDNDVRYRDKSVIERLEREVIKDKRSRFMTYHFTAFTEEGHKKGMKEGLQQGIEKGIEKGREEGREEGKEERDHEIVLKMLGKGLDAKTISSYTGLSEKDVNSIKSKPKNGSSN